MTRFHNFESTVTIVFQFYSMKGIERQIEIILSAFPKKSTCFWQMGLI